MTSPALEWHLTPGDTIRRTELHERYGGSSQNGISPSRQSPNILLFTDPSSGEQHGYFDEWAEDGTFHYCGEGQVGDQTFIRGNKAVLEYEQDGRALRLFDGSSGVIRYVGEFVLDENDRFHYDTAPETGGGPLRQVIKFHLIRTERSAPISTPEVPVGDAYRQADETVQPAPAQLSAPDTELVGRNLTAHRRLQNALATAVAKAGLDPLSPRPEDPAFDLAWRLASRQLVVCEIKSLTVSNESHQLRTGIGQVLDYLDQVSAREPDTRGVLWIEREPSHLRWVDLCRRVGIQLAWPGQEDLVLI